ncbi:MAG: tRNA (adenosine(37)-N6)-threonylcarbamoyltransferase complex ATPase subunit type 1 TsaE [Erysipelotrichaceae bacterium]
MFILETNNSEETQDLASKIALKLWAGSTILLTGDLGAGKTCFTQGLARGLNIKKIVNSPTFTILKIYNEGRLPLYHLDAYRLSSGFQDVGFSELIEDDGVMVVEWPQYLQPLLPKQSLNINIEWLSADRRRITISATGDKYINLLEELL